MSPYKDKEKQREYDKERKRKIRQGRTGRTKEGRTDNGITEEKKREGLTKGINKEGLTEDGTFFKGDVEYVPASYGLPERPRFLKLSDGQVLDRAN